MKKFFIISAIMAVLGLASCNKEESKAIVGKWEATTIEMTIEGIKMEMDIAEMGAGMSFLFKADGTGSVSEDVDGSAMTVDFEYSLSDGLLTLTIEGDSESIPVTIDGNRMSMIMDGDILDEPDMTVKIHFVKK